MIVKTVLLSLIVTYVTTLSEEEFANRNVLFTADIYKEILKKEKGNFLISPFSAELALALVQSGSNNETRREILNALHLSDIDQDTRKSFKNILRVLKKDKLVSASTANKIYIKKNIAIKDRFKKIATGSYQAEVENINFSQNQEAANTINQWVENQTDHKIKNLVNPSILNSDTTAIITNALFLKAEFSVNFRRVPITKKTFFKTATETVEVDSMVNEGYWYFYHRSTELKARFLELSLSGDNEIVMVIVLPDEKEGIRTLESNLEKVFSPYPLEEEHLHVTLPLFKIESSVDFKEVFQKLGVKKAFVRNEADFSGLAGNEGEVAIDGILQKSLISVNQHGIEVNGTTHIWVTDYRPPQTAKLFTVDRPFIFYIKKKDVILLAGRVTTPNQ